MNDLVPIAGSKRFYCTEKACKSQGNVVTASHKHKLDVVALSYLDAVAIADDDLPKLPVQPMSNDRRRDAYYAQPFSRPSQSGKLTVRQERHLRKMATRQAHRDGTL